MFATGNIVMSTGDQTHWESIYGAKKFTDVSWYQEIPTKSLELLEAAGIVPDNPIIDIGGGASTLVDNLVRLGCSDVTVLDIAEKALEQARQRLGAKAENVKWVVADITLFEPTIMYRVWHDRAVLHFLTEPGDRERYVDVLKRALAPGGLLILAAFGPRGPLKCSGLEIRRYTVEMTAELLGSSFEMRSHELENHVTPWGESQQFLHTSWTRRDND
jgi:ubiquinone/menaquinone biosynthesis C-methylase UbiE